MKKITNILKKFNFFHPLKILILFFNYLNMNNFMHNQIGMLNLLYI
jgi:hypothetical protein